jgi:glutamate---cysteine ligase / carboxylate-amine ligase
MSTEAITFGVEEEFLLVDPKSCLVVPLATEVLAEVPMDLRHFIKHELLATQLEIATPICTNLAELRKELVRLRSITAEAAVRAGCRVLPAGTGLLDTDSPSIVSDNDRFEQQAYTLGALIDLPGMCACHVHVGIRDRETAVAVTNHLRPWLPVVHALGTNSPFAGGRDTSYASWRSMRTIRYPTSGPPPKLESAAHYDRIVANLISCGAMADNRALYWYTRPSPVHPTIEIRVGDVCPTVDDTLIVAALVRALVVTAVADIDAGRPAPEVEDRLLVGAHWRAARFGLEGDGADVMATRLRPSWDLVDLLIERVTPALIALGDMETVSTLRDTLQANGSGAMRQRAVYSTSGDLRQVVQYLVDQVSPPLDISTSSGRSAGSVVPAK